MGHFPPGDGDRDMFQKIFKPQKIDAYFHGHSHRTEVKEESNIYVANAGGAGQKAKGGVKNKHGFLYVEVDLEKETFTIDVIAVKVDRY